MSIVPVSLSNVKGAGNELQEEALDLTMDKRGTKRGKDQNEISFVLDAKPSCSRSSIASCDMCCRNYEAGSLSVTVLENFENSQLLYLLLAKTYRNLGSDVPVPKLITSCPNCSSHIQKIAAYLAREHATIHPTLKIDHLNQIKTSKFDVGKSFARAKTQCHVSQTSDIPHSMKNLTLESSVGLLYPSSFKLVLCELCKKKTNASELILFPLVQRYVDTNSCKSHPEASICLPCFNSLQTRSIVKMSDSPSPKCGATYEAGSSRSLSKLIQRNFSEADIPEGLKTSSTSTLSLGFKFLEVPIEISDEFRLPSYICQRPMNIETPCYLCDSTSRKGFTYCLSSKCSNLMPYHFPFLCNIVSAHPEAQFDDLFLVCAICFHSLVKQWYKWEKFKKAIDERKYDIKNFTCYICGMVTYRKRTHFLRVKDYPFLNDHIPPQDGLIMKDGSFVNACRDCSVSLKDQYSDMEKYGVPVNKRQYNWIKKPPPPETDAAGEPSRAMYSQTSSFMPSKSVSTVGSPSSSSHSQKVNERSNSESPFSPTRRNMNSSEAFSSGVIGTLIADVIGEEVGFVADYTTLKKQKKL